MGLPDRLKRLFPTPEEYEISLENQIVEYMLKNPLVTRKHIVAKFKTKEHKVSNICRKHGISFNGSKVLPDVKDERVELYHQGWSIYKISKHLQMCPKGIDRWMRRALGKDFRLKPKDRLPRRDGDVSADQ